jgi:hypothetical protein
MGALTEREDEWSRRATAAAIAAARRVVLGDGAVINKNTPVGRLSDHEFGWITSAAIFAWIATHAEQATVEGLDVEQTIRVGMLDPANPWDAGMIATILPKLADAPGIDWQQPLSAWSRETVVAFLLTALDLIRAAQIARDLGGGSITRKRAAMTNEGDPIPF